MKLIQHLWKKSRKETAQVMAEFALILPIIAIILAMMFSGGQLLMANLAMQQAAYEGARVGVTMPDATQADTKAKEAATKFVENMPFVDVTQVQVTTYAPSWAKKQPLEVTTKYDVKLIFPIPNGVLTPKTNHTVERKIKMAIENG
ncbi:TadE/TadG family type IV pilus assembly protein [Cytobacillus sp. FJAT-54145]|uniref:TadE/TadG family type IV pilus assembly protein n=1 Tax=Cytobacillus spartinae TaxID=3299023 RepID=A0ABW6KDF2_9BACI